MTCKPIHIQSLMELLCFLLFGLSILYLLLSGQYLSYVTPRMAPYLWFTAAIMLIWAILTLFRLFQVRHRKRIAHCLLLFIPVLLLLLPHKTVEPSTLSGSAGLLTGGSFQDSAVSGDEALSDAWYKSPDTGIPSSSPPQEDPARSAQNSYLSVDAYGRPLDLHGYDEAKRTVTVSNDEFYNWLGTFYMNSDTFDGFQVTMTGSVYKDSPLFSENEFVPARLVMSCCVADLAPCGLICQYDHVDELKQDSWVTVTGTLFQGQYQGMDEVYLKVSSVEPAEPVKGYIFPYN